MCASKPFGLPVERAKREYSAWEAGDSDNAFVPYLWQTLQSDLPKFYKQIQALDA